MENLFKDAVKNKYRYSYKGKISTEDLFDLNLDELDSIYKELNKMIKNENEDSLLSANTVDKETLAKIDIVKYIFNAKQAEALKRLQTAEKRAQKDKLLSVLANKQDEQLYKMSIDEITEMIKNLD